MTETVDEIGKAIAAGQQSRIGLAVSLARQFQHNPKRFDPRGLERLGKAGLQRFLETVGAGAASVIERPTTVPRSSNLTAIAPSGMGWPELRRREIPVWISGMASGVRAGAIVTAFGLSVLVFVERIIPPAGRILS